MIRAIISCWFKALFNRLKSLHFTQGFGCWESRFLPSALFGQVPSHHITFLRCVVVNFYSSFKAQIIGHPLQLTPHQLLSPSHKPCVCCPNLMTTHTLHCCNDPFWKLPFPWKRLWRTKYLIHPLILTAKHKAWYMLWTSSLGEEWHRQRCRIF